jgi:hypothetical protein
VDEQERRVWARAQRAIDAAINVQVAKCKARGLPAFNVSAQDVQLYDGYAEPGHDGERVATGNWNTCSEYDRETSTRVDYDATMPRLLKVLEALGFECEWSDEWTTCDDCGKLVRTSPDGWGWTPSYAMVDECSTVCMNCLDPSEHLASLEGDADKINTIASIDPADHGYKRLPDDYETGWHEGQDARPQLVAKALEKQGIERFLFNVEDVRQFDSTWSAWVHEDEWDLLDLEKFAKEETDGPSVSGAAKRFLEEAGKAVK